MAWPFKSSGRPTTAASADGIVTDQRAFDFDRAEPVAGDVDDVIDTTHDPVIAIRHHSERYRRSGICRGRFPSIAV